MLLAIWRRSCASNLINSKNIEPLCASVSSLLKHDLIDKSSTLYSDPFSSHSRHGVTTISSTTHHQRHFFTLPGFEEDLAKRYTEKKLLGYSTNQIFDVVASVEHYKEFVPWCLRSVVVNRHGDSYLEAELEVGFQVFVERYLSKVTLERPTKISSHVGESTLFSHLDSSWRFQPGPTPQSVWLTFEVDFAFKSPLYRHVASLFFEEVVQRMMEAFEGRCRKLYGPSSLLNATSTATESPSAMGAIKST